MPNPGIFPVQVRLLPGKIMQIPGTCTGIITPSILFKITGTISRTPFFQRPPMVIFIMGIFAGLPGFHKPRMFVARMIDHQIEHQLHPAVMHFPQQFVKILHRPALLHNCTIITDIISVIVVRRSINGTQPDNIYPKTAYITQPGNNSPEIADPVPVAIHKTPGINLIYDDLFPPIRPLFCLLHNSLFFICIFITVLPIPPAFRPTPEMSLPPFHQS